MGSCLLLIEAGWSYSVICQKLPSQLFAWITPDLYLSDEPHSCWFQTPPSTIFQTYKLKYLIVYIPKCHVIFIRTSIIFYSEFWDYRVQIFKLLISNGILQTPYLFKG
jgi:hypothetical protein